jgi:hypothetical protein
MVVSFFPQSMVLKSSQVNTLPKAKSQAKDKRAKDRQKHAALRCKVGVAPPGFEVRRRMSSHVSRMLNYLGFHAKTR